MHPLRYRHAPFVNLLVAGPILGIGLIFLYTALLVLLADGDDSWVIYLAFVTSIYAFVLLMVGLSTIVKSHAWIPLVIGGLVISWLAFAGVAAGVDPTGVLPAVLYWVGFWLKLREGRDTESVPH